MSFDTALKRPALYNPALWSRDEVRTYYVARPQLLARFIDDFRREQAGTRPQHRLILGQRGMGKSTLLRRLAIAVDDDPELAAIWLPLVFPEEQYNVANLADFWLNCLDALGDTLESHGRIAEMNAIDAEVERLDRKDGEAALQALLRSAEQLGRRLILLVDNIDLILDRLKDKHWALREALQEHPQLMLVGASSRALETSYDYGRAFYDFFRIDELRGLSETEMRETIINLARLRGAEELIQRLQTDPSRLRVLHTLTGGNPRTAVLLYGVLLKGIDGDVRSDLEGLLDEVTPLYKARFDELPAQAQQLLDRLALHWHPMTARQAADTLGWEINPTSAQLDRLVQAGIVEKVKSGSGKRMAFQVAERFFNIWYLMRASRRVRRKLMWLVEFLRVFFSLDELHKHANNQLTNQCNEPAAAEYMLALGRAIGNAPIARALEMKALGALIAGGQAHLEEMFDLRGEDADLATRAERIQARHTLRMHLQKQLACNPELCERILGLPLEAKELENIVRQEIQENSNLAILDKRISEVEEELIAQLGKVTFETFQRAIVLGDLVDLHDIEAGEAAAIHLNEPRLALLCSLVHLLKTGDSAIKVSEAAKQFLAIEPEAALGWHALGASLLNMDPKYSNEAISALRKCLEFTPNDTVATEKLARALSRDNSNLKEVEETLSRILEIEPTHQWAKQKLCLLLMKNDNGKHRVMSLAQQLYDENPKEELNQRIFALALLSYADSDEEKLLAAERAVLIAPHEAAAHVALLVCYLKKGSLEKVLEEAQQYFSLLDKQDEVDEAAISFLPDLLKAASVAGIGNQLLAIFDASGLAEKALPAREALAIIVAKDPGLLNNLAPEIRLPTLEILKYAAPELAAQFTGL